ncbi:SDR family NAD(P)-dependent oxidoreductase [Kineosporia sp. R_H_3]|uniref:SDR family NAD(P)-dependent oxidoreductase n=1 Tax=Kineosporia sp. R_H_3 TaxID=1961848 RepID=UPI001E4DAF05|nr:SDR family NAD(P)-dependent oxidoreductase [Kineosporia sp. R_H_3]
MTTTSNGATVAGQDFAGLVAAVTGGASGIGLAVALTLAARGARVAVLDIGEVPAEATAAGLFGVRCDVTDDASVRAAVAIVVETLGGLDVVVANAGIGAQGTVEENDDAEWLRVLDLNVVGTARTVRAALPHLRASRAPSVVVTASVASWAGLPRRALYSASKGALLTLTLAMAADHVREGIRVNAVAPGTADTPWVGRLLDAASDPAAERAALEARQPMGRLVSAEEVAHAVAYLASPLSASTTGTVLAVDGGMYGLRLPK